MDSAKHHSPSNNSMGRKRQRLRSPATEPESSQDESVASPAHGETEYTGFIVGDFSSTPGSLLVHTVACGLNVIGHEEHAQVATYLDPPRLFEGDSHASALRGKERLPGHVQDYFESYDDANLIIKREYHCVYFHNLIGPSFVKLPRPRHPEIPTKARPYFYILPRDSDIPNASKESVIPSPALKRAMDNLALHDQTFRDWEHRLVPPYLQLWPNLQRLRTLAEEILDSSDCERVDQLAAHIKQSSEEEYDEAMDWFSSGLVTKQHLAKLFKVGDVVVRIEDGEPRAFVLTFGPLNQSSSFNLQGYHWTFDGQFHKETQHLTVKWPKTDSEAIPIDSLDVYPLLFNTSGELEKELRDRGRMVWECRTRCLMGYDAPKAAFEIQVSNARYMLDYEGYREVHQTDGDNEIRRQGQSDDLPETLLGRDEPPDDPFLLLLPPRIHGFGLHDKKWRSLLVKHLHPVEWQKDAFRKLVLDQHKKDLIEAMVQVHISSNMSPDVIEGKGKGLIVLLHGGPGTGKTLTAESVAELTERPLYRVTCGDIGTDPESVEKYLESVFYIGTTWKAVILLDEADVFLEEREKNDLQRNALVSVFLRVLEYYEGILILTSNRIGTFDEAFKSRVQLAIHYPPIDEKGRISVWNNFFRLLVKQRKDPNSAEDGIIELDNGEKINMAELSDNLKVLAQEKLNGRQIRNAITSARQLAQFQNKPMGCVHLDQTIRVVNEFETYIEKTHGHKDGEYLKERGIRS
ncbi:P-loop containing nucleoside triphosphate hydrolase protein [Thelonectria olida]|uniref:P-loop containing nucleoside triphosphate hydrolase protein n=1 Tax=Thelonectria olida TaxID=1576542 RepID=A0A9P9ATC4_9HYPO|nr:P-loop containing nucleoside triphosphate hydrolase protein [Thelonectria olida]